MNETHKYQWSLSTYIVFRLIAAVQPSRRTRIWLHSSLIKQFFKCRITQCVQSRKNVLLYHSRLTRRSSKKSRCSNLPYSTIGSYKILNGTCTTRSLTESATRIQEIQKPEQFILFKKNCLGSYRIFVGSCLNLIGTCDQKLSSSAKIIVGSYQDLEDRILRKS